MPMLGVTRLILDSEEGSARGEEDFFSVARTMPFVAERPCQSQSCRVRRWRGRALTLDAERRNALVDCVQGILCLTASVFGYVVNQLRFRCGSTLGDN